MLFGERVIVIIIKGFRVIPKPTLLPEKIIHLKSYSRIGSFILV